jgi:4-amino-4-deoxy-L-arabinose transferase-like glycosyltransferase
MPNSALNSPPASVTRPGQTSLYSSPRKAWLFLLVIYFAVHFAALFAPPLEDDVDGTHAQAAQHMALTGDYVTMYVNGIRYLEKPPLPYWLISVDYRIFGYNVFSTHLPLTLGVLALAILVWTWSRRAFSDRAAFYSALAVLTSVGIFLYTRFLIPEILLSLWLGLALYFTVTSLEDGRPGRIYVAWAVLALAMLTKGLIAPVFFLAAMIPWLLITGDWRRWRELRPFSGIALFLLIAAPWHILAGLHNPDHGHPVGNVPSAAGVHGFFYFYFINEHVLRFLGKRFPHDYNKQSAWIFWLGHLIWLFPWSLYLPLVVHRLWRTRGTWLAGLRQHSTLPEIAREEFRRRTIWLLALYAGFILIFFSVSTNQEYYTFPSWFALLMLTASVVASYENNASEPNPDLRRKTGESLIGVHLLLTVVGVATAIALGSGLWRSRHLAFVPDVGAVLAHRGVGGYSLSMSHIFDLTDGAFAGLRLPAILAAIALLLGPAIALRYRQRDQDLQATVSVALTSAIFLIAAHIALVRFGGMLGSRPFADTINRISGNAAANPALKDDAQLIIYGDQANASSVIFYTQRPALLVNGRTSSMIWGSYYPDAPHIFLNDDELLALWGTGPRHYLIVTGDDHDHVAALLQGRAISIQELADKTLYTDQPIPQ